MKKVIMRLFYVSLLCFAFSAGQGCVKKEEMPLDQTDNGTLTLKTMGSIMFGGTVGRVANGETFHGDHGYAQYYIPQKSKNYPLIMWHGTGQSGKTWETTADGREGYQALMPRRGWSVYIIDQPRRGRAGYTQSKGSGGNPTTEHESAAWDAFRLGVWMPPAKATVYKDMQFPINPSSVDQFFRWQTPNTGDEPFPGLEHRIFMAHALGDLLKRTGPAILVTHSNSGQYGWTTAIENPDMVKAVVAYEPGAFSFPEGERPEEVPVKNKIAEKFMQPQMIPMDDFMKLTKIPILIIYGDNIATELSDVFNVEIWRLASSRAKQFVETVNRHGGDARIVFLPDLGMKGNTHVPFADKNNQDVANQLTDWFDEKALDISNNPHAGPSFDTLKEFTIPIDM